MNYYINIYKLFAQYNGIRSCQPPEVMEKYLGEYYSTEELEDLKEILKSPPLYTTVRVNTLKCTKAEAKSLLLEHFKNVKEPFQVEENSDFDDVLMIKAIGPNEVHPSDKGT